MYRRTAVLLLSTLLLAGIAASPAGPTPTPAPTPAATPEAEIVVLAASSLTAAFGELGRAFEAAHPGVRVTFSFAGSQQLAQQIALGAPADVFASANTAQMTTAIRSGRIVSGTERVLARNRLVVVCPPDNPGRIAALADLAAPGKRLVVGAREVPAGQYALAFLDKAALDPTLGPAFRAGVLANVASYEQNVRAVLSKVTLGEADAGIAYDTDAAGVEPGGIVRLDIPDALNEVAVYPIAALADSREPGPAAAFVELALSAPGQDVLASWGFMRASP